jgi:hypothetical protein
LWSCIRNTFFSSNYSPKINEVHKLCIKLHVFKQKQFLHPVTNWLQDLLQGKIFFIVLILIFKYLSVRGINFDSFYNSLADSPNVNFEKDQKTLTTVIKKKKKKKKNGLRGQ